ncbi:acetyltransferase (GNAT) domain-containing protein [Sarocladium implicatum]|nr:acetyltransferase (GNAT) domain-containing protein [Sarocladium implicatum]
MPDQAFEATVSVDPEPGATILKTDRLILRRWTPDDAQDLQSIVNYPQVTQNLSTRFPYPFTLKDAEACLTRWATMDEPAVYPTSIAICLKPQNADEKPQLIGSMGLKPGEGIEYRTWFLGYFLTPSAWGKGLATEAMSAMIQWSFKTWPKLNRIEASFYSGNTASERVLQKSGLLKEGVRRGATEKNGVVQDDIIYGVLRSDLGM